MLCLFTVVRFKTKSGAPNENIVQNHLNIAYIVERILVFKR